MNEECVKKKQKKNYERGYLTPCYGNKTIIQLFNLNP